MFGVNRTGLIAKISVKYVLPTCIWKYFWRISGYFAFLGEFRGNTWISRVCDHAKYQKPCIKLDSFLPLAYLLTINHITAANLKLSRVLSNGASPLPEQQGFSTNFFSKSEMPVSVYPVNTDTFRIDRCINGKIMGISVIGSWYQ